MLFCPNCSNVVVYKTDPHTGSKFWCKSCPYEYAVHNQYFERKQLPSKKVDDVLGGEDEWKNANRIEAPCPRCQHDWAYYMQIQIRSADEPMTTFYRCVSCGHNWREN